jgi:hypothetical protein
VQHQLERLIETRFACGLTNDERDTYVVLIVREAELLGEREL